MKIFAAAAGLMFILLMPNMSVAAGDISVTVNVSERTVTEQQAQGCVVSADSSQDTPLDASDKINCESDLIDYQSVESNGQQVVLVIPLWRPLS